MNEDRVAGTAKSLGGKVEEGFGRVTGDAKTQTEGLTNQAAGAVGSLRSGKGYWLGCRSGGASKRH
jgi:uncharacterized protein YjbJ (UPF0337 family)